MNAVQFIANVLVLFAALQLLSGEPAQAQSLSWDGTAKTNFAKLGETNVSLIFRVTNASPSDVVFRAVRTSCGCTVPKLPPLPWKLLSGKEGQVEILVDLRGKRGLLSKVISVDTTAGLRLLTVNVSIPDPPANERDKNLLLAAADRQAVFKNECATCHAHPTIGKKGEALYEAACGICHEAAHRASMVPDLKALNKPTDRDYWTAWVKAGKPGTLMPAFSKADGGPLEEEQIQSLVDYLADKFRPAANADRETGNTAAGRIP